MNEDWTKDPMQLLQRPFSAWAAQVQAIADHEAKVRVSIHSLGTVVDFRCMLQLTLSHGVLTE